MRRQTLHDLVGEIHALTLLRKDVQRHLPHQSSVAARGVLAVLAEAGPVRTGVLADLTRVDASVTSRHVAHLCDEGLVERLPDPSDGRSTLIAVTDTGRAELTRLREAVVDGWTGALAGWAEQDVAQLVLLLRRLQTDLDDTRSPRPPHAAPQATAPRTQIRIPRQEPATA